jgi:prophage regulatory protein
MQLVDDKPKLEKFLRKPAVMDITGLSDPSLDRLVKDEKFPKPLKIAPRCIAWRESDIIAWQQSREVA